MQGMPTIDIDYQFNESRLIEINNLLNLNIISKSLWKLYLDLTYNFIFIKDKTLFISTCMKNKMKNILYTTEYDTQ